MGRSRLGWIADCALVAFVVLGVGVPSSRALINPNFPPDDLVLRK